MRFKAYKIIVGSKMERIKITDVNDFFSSLDESPKLEDEEDEDQYAIMYLKRYEQYILGTFVQSYHKVLTKFEKEGLSKKEVQLKDTSINDKTLFFVNCDEGIIYIQSKRYPEYLTPGIMIERFQRSLGKCLSTEVYFLPTQINNTLDQVEEIFNTSFVSRIAFRNLCGLEIPEGTELHNPKKELDDALRESYNTYSANKLDSMEFKAKKGEQLGKNPFVKIGLMLAKANQDVEIFKDMEIIESGEKVNVKMKGNDSKIISMSKKQQDNTLIAYETILKRSIKGYSSEED